MSDAGRSSDEIIARMRATGTRLAMDEAQQAALRAHGVPSSTIEALIAAEREAQRIDELTVEADRAAMQKQQEEARRERYRHYDPYPYPYYGRWHPYFGYSRYRHFDGWHGGLGWGW